MRTRDINPRGLRQRVCLWGPDEGPVVICCHGWLDQAAAWDAVAIKLVARGFRVVAPDHRGHGHSAWTPGGSTYHFMEYVADLDALVDALALQDPILVGHSMGGTIASLWAGLRPGGPAGLVLLDGLGPPRVETESAVDQAVAFLDQNRTAPARRLVASPEAAAEKIRRTNAGLSESQALALAHRAVEATPDGWAWRWDPLHRTRAAVAYDADRHMAILRRIECPVAVGVGSQSWYAMMPDLESRVSAIGPLVAHETFACGHDLHHAEVDGVVRLVEQVDRAQAEEPPPGST